MITPTRRTVIAYLAGTFLLGAVAGGALGYGYGRRPFFRSFDRDKMRTQFCDRLVSDLGLTPTQRTELDPIMRQNMEEFEASHRDHFQQLGELMKRHEERIQAILNPAQREKFITMQREREKERESRFPKRGTGQPSDGPSPGK